MGFKNNCYATIWKQKDGSVIKLGDNYAAIKISTSFKRGDGSFATDFNKVVLFKGQALDTVKSVKLSEKDRLHLLEVETKINGKGEAFICWKCEMAGNAPPKPIEIVDDPLLQPVNEEDLPF